MYRTRNPVRMWAKDRVKVRKPRGPRPLTLRQQNFVVEYLKTYNGKWSAIAAGYPEKNARSRGSTLLHNPKIIAELEKGRVKIVEDNNITVQKVIDGLLDETNEDKAGSTQSARVQAWTQLGRYLSMFTDNQNVNNSTLEERMREADKRLADEKTFEGTDPESDVIAEARKIMNKGE